MSEEPGCAGLLRRLAVSDDRTIRSIFAGEITDLGTIPSSVTRRTRWFDSRR